MLYCGFAFFGFTVIHLLTAGDPELDVLSTAASSSVRLLAIACILHGLRGCPAELRWVWYLLLARICWALVFVPLRNFHVTDVFWWTLDIVLATVVYIAAACLLVRSRVVLRDHALWLDVASITMGVGVLLYTFLGAPLMLKSGMSALVIINAVLLPTLDVMLIGLCLLLIFGLRGRDVSLLLLINAFLVLGIANVTVQLGLVGLVPMARLQATAPFSVLVTALIGMAALHPTARQIPASDLPHPVSLGAGRPMLLVIAFTLTLAGLVFGQAWGAHVSPPVVAAILTGMFLLVVTRVQLTSRSLQRSERRVVLLANRDPATGIANLAGLSEHLRGLEVGDHQAIALLLLRLRTYHDVGQLWQLPIRERWIARLVTQLQRAVAPFGLLARISVDQFVVLTVDGNADKRVQDELARAMIAACRQVTVDTGLTISTTVDIGITSSIFPCELPALLIEAESALELARTQGENRHVHHDSSIAASQHRRLSLLIALREAVANNELELLYQPIVDMETRDTIAYEALLRWNSSKFGNVSPAEFIPLAESIDAIDAITDWVLDQACRTLAAMPPNRHGSYRLSINVSARTLRHPGLADRVALALARHRLDPGELCIEVTERENFEDRHQALPALRRLGVVIAIDDFGSGYSNISMLTKVDADVVKLDLEFVRLAERNDAMHGLCRSLAASNLRVVAEGIETEAQHELLLRLGCRYGQGWLYGRAAPLSQLEATGIVAQSIS